MPTWRSILLSLLLCTTWLACSEPEPPPAPDAGVTADAGPGDSGSDAGTDDAGTNPSDAGSDGGTDDGAVRVRRFLRHITPGGVEELPEDFTRSPVELFVVEGDTLVSVPGIPGGPGEYVFPNVPRATCYVKSGTDHVVTDARSVDLSVNRYYRTGIETFEGDAELQVNVSGVEPWFWTGDFSAPLPELNFFTDEAGYGWPSLVTLDREGQSRVEETIPVLDLPRFEQARGDRAWVTQLAPRVLGQRPDGGTQHYLTAVGALHLPPFSHDGTGPLRIEGSLERLEMSEVAVDFRATEFFSYGAEAHPSAVANTSSLRLYSAAVAPSEGWDSDFQLLRLSVRQSSAYDVQGTLAYGNPSPSQETVVGQALVFSILTFEIPEESPLEVVTATLSVNDRLPRLAAGPIRPGVLSPQALSVDGVEAYSSRTLAAGSHVVSWQPSSQPRPDAYVLRLNQLLRQGDIRYFFAVARFYVEGGTTSIRLPPGLMKQGEHYYLSVEAVRSEGYAVSGRPLTLPDRIGVSRALAISGLLSVPAQAP